MAQVIEAEEPDLVRRVILAGTGPAGGPGTSRQATPVRKTYLTPAKGRSVGNT
ncbi:hypothetical protein EES45_33935 [Streptomyces sp. ADI97-07]|nr:hypothetical protein EES45_33935 [Streptomyces sp. ADI97-07]